MLKKISKYKPNKYYPNSEKTELFDKLLRISDPSPILTPVIDELYETDEYYIITYTDNTEKLFGCNVYDKSQLKRIPELGFGGFLTRSEIENRLSRYA